MAGVYIGVPRGEEEVLSQPPLVSPTVPPAFPSPTAVPPVPPDLPPPAEGYTWFLTPQNWSTHFAVQIRVDWIRTVDANFVPEGTPLNFPYPQIPQLMVFVGRAEPNPPDTLPGRQHPFVWEVGSQGGGGCSRDVSQTAVSPSVRLAAGVYTWDIYAFTCSVVNLNFPPGVTYDGRAAEARVGDLILSVVAFEPVGSGATAQVFEDALRSFRLQ